MTVSQPRSISLAVKIQQGSAISHRNNIQNAENLMWIFNDKNMGKKQCCSKHLWCNINICTEEKTYKNCSTSTVWNMKKYTIVSSNCKG